MDDYYIPSQSEIVKAMRLYRHKWEYYVDGKDKGRKDDSGKLQWSLIPFSALEGTVRVLQEGAKKYTVDNWKHVPDGINRYRNALMRHMFAYLGGEEADKETGESHLDHAMCNLLFLRWLEDRKDASE
jgi:hypothetical protein